MEKPTQFQWQAIAFRRSMLKLSSIVSVIFLSSCVDDLKYDLKMNDFKSCVNINATFTNDSTWKVYISKSSGMMSGENWDIVEDAMVTISDGDGVTSVLHAAGNGKYTLSQKPLYNKHYYLKAIVPGFQIMEAGDFQPEPIQIDALSFKDSVGTSDSLYLSQLLVTLTDKEAQNNFFQIMVYQKDSTHRLTSLLLRSNDLAFENIPNSGIITGTSDFQEYLVASDRLFNGKAYTFNLKFIKAYPNCDTFVEIRSLSPALHDYVLSYSKFNDNIENPFAEPIRVYTNIKNGLGIFGGYSSYTKKVVP